MNAVFNDIFEDINWFVDNFDYDSSARGINYYNADNEIYDYVEFRYDKLFASEEDIVRVCPTVADYRAFEEYYIDMIGLDIQNFQNTIATVLWHIATDYGWLVSLHINKILLEKKKSAFKKSSRLPAVINDLICDYIARG